MPSIFTSRDIFADHNNDMTMHKLKIYMSGFAISNDVNKAYVYPTQKLALKAKSFVRKCIPTSVKLTIKLVAGGYIVKAISNETYVHTHYAFSNKPKDTVLKACVFICENVL